MVGGYTVINFSGFEMTNSPKKFPGIYKIVESNRGAKPFVFQNISYANVEHKAFVPICTGEADGTYTFDWYATASNRYTIKVNSDDNVYVVRYSLSSAQPSSINEEKQVASVDAKEE